MCSGESCLHAAAEQVAHADALPNFVQRLVTRVTAPSLALQVPDVQNACETELDRTECGYESLVERSRCRWLTDGMCRQGYAVRGVET